MTDGSAARGDRVNLHDRRAKTHSRDFRVKGALILAGVVRNVGRCAAHVEADQALVSVRRACRDHPDDAPGGS